MCCKIDLTKIQLESRIKKPYPQKVFYKMPSGTCYKLLYFDFRWIAEPIRYLFSYVGQEFEDVRLDWGQWEKGGIDKTPYRYGKLPILEVKETGGAADGKVIQVSQSFNILRYLGKKFELVGRSLEEDSKCDEISYCLYDILKEVEGIFTDDDKIKPDIQAKIRDTVIPRYFSVFEEELKNKKREGGGNKTPLVGDRITWLDFQFAHFSELFEQMVKGKGSLLLDNYPMIREHQEWVFGLEGVKEWRGKRPVTEY